jgi:hypothetical protein
MTFGPKVTITIDPSNFAAAGDEVTAETGRATTIWMDDAVGHELGGHAAGSLLIHQAGGMRPTRHNPGWCDETCARKFDNTYRDQRGLPPIW